MSTATPPIADGVAHGPVWRRTDSGWVLPDHTLGWQVVDWILTYLCQPDGPTAGERFRPTHEQVRFLLWWYAVDEAGRFAFRRGTLRRMKGWGKDPISAVIAAVELCGPCRFSHWEGDEPVATSHAAAWVQIAATSKDQTRNTMTLFPRIFSRDALGTYGIDLGKEIIHTTAGGRIEAVTSSPRTLEGGRPSLVIKNETQHWLSSNEGLEMSKAIARNLAKSRDGSARALAITNPHQPGEDSDAEREWEAWQHIESGSSRGTGVLYDSLEASPETVLADEESLRTGLAAARGDSYWLDIDRLVEEIYDPATSPEMARRFYLNQVVAAEDAWVAPHEWDALADPGLVLADGEIITLGFDGSRTDDHSALMACRVEDGALFTLGVWDPQRHGGEAPREEISATVDQAFNFYDVVAFFSDLHPWESYVDRWAEEHGHSLCAKAGPQHPIAWDMRGRTKEFVLSGAERMLNEITERAFSHDGDPRVRQHVHNARRRTSAWGLSFGKEHRESSRKVDALPSSILARMARRSYVALPKSKQRRKRSGRAAFG